MLIRPIITLTTDFGAKDPFVGIMKGVILGINPNAEIIDISHGISPRNIFEASHVLSMSYSYFPRSTIHVAVIDPGVGGTRKPLLITSDRYSLIGPDNGVFTQVIKQENDSGVHIIHISAHDYYLDSVGATFHGRDIFAPVAAWLSKGVAREKFGAPITRHVSLPLPEPRVSGDTVLKGEVVYIDRFGNAITNISRPLLKQFSVDAPPDSFRVIFKNRKLRLARYYQEKKGAGLTALFNSFDLLELFSYGENASDVFGIKTGDTVSVTREQ